MHDFNNNVAQKLKLSKDYFHKKCAPSILVFFRKSQMSLDVENKFECQILTFFDNQSVNGFKKYSGLL